MLLHSEFDMSYRQVKLLFPLELTFFVFSVGGG